mmetsp:Transcript_7825/g.17987  ORF Transcript_7825/g.17987 Transcript_7825/m.17987 type:complete len:170 (+) Transcript_7825:236-745(+)
MSKMSLIVDFPSSRCRQGQGNLPKQEGRESLRVTFSNTCEVKIVPALTTLTTDGSNLLFYSKEDIKSFKDQSRALICALKRNGFALEDLARRNISSSEVFMGLEAYLNYSVARELSLRRANYMASVLEEHKRQTEVGIVDEDKLARAAAISSEWSQVRARIIGLMHEDE